MLNALKRLADKMTTGFPTAPPAYGLKGPPATVTVEKSLHPSHTEILTLPIDTESTIALFEQLLPTYAAATYIYVICDNARYYHSRAVQVFLEGSRIQLIFLPAYAPNLNVIERLWHFFKKKVLYNRYYETFDRFQTACENFFRHPQ